MRAELAAFIEENASDIITTGGISEEKIKELEEELGLAFRGEYRDFLGRYGMLLGYGVEILGCGKGEAAPVVTQTKRFRRSGLTHEYLVIRNADEWIYCLSNSDGTVSSWDGESRRHLLVSDSLDEYIFEELSATKRDWD